MEEWVAERYSDSSACTDILKSSKISIDFSIKWAICEDRYWPCDKCVVVLIQLHIHEYLPFSTFKTNKPRNIPSLETNKPPEGC